MTVLLHPLAGDWPRKRHCLPVCGLLEPSGESVGGGMRDVAYSSSRLHVDEIGCSADAVSSRLPWFVVILELVSDRTCTNGSYASMTSVPVNNLPLHLLPNKALSPLEVGRSRSQRRKTEASVQLTQESCNRSPKQTFGMQCRPEAQWNGHVVVCRRSSSSFGIKGARSAVVDSSVQFNHFDLGPVHHTSIQFPLSMQFGIIPIILAVIGIAVSGPVVPGGPEGETDVRDRCKR